MIQFCVIQSLVCFQTNITVSLDVQTRSLIFKAWPRTDSSTELNVCKQLSGDLYKLSILTGSYTYALSQLQKYGVGASIDITIPCVDLVNNCASAFKATSAIYVMEFQNAKVVVNEAAQNLRRVDFNRKDCVRDPKLLYGQNIQIAPGVYSNVFKFSGTPTKICKYPLDSMTTLIANDPTQKKAVVTFTAFPNFSTISLQFSVSLSTLFQHGTYPCSMMPSPAVVSWCDSMIQTFATQSFGYNQVQYFVPGKIPNRDGTITRVANYSISYETNVVVNTLQATFDCYSSQNILMYANTLLLTNTMNPAINYCNTTMSSFIGFAYDKMVTRVIFQENEDFRTGKVFILDFTTWSQVLNSTSEWLDCDLSTNATYCKEVLAQQSIISSYQLSAQQLIYKNDVLLKIFPLSPTLSVSCLQDATSRISDSQACVSITNICQNATSNQQFTFSFKSAQGHINITTQAEFPNSESKYCVNRVFSREQVRGISGGVVQIGSQSVPISSFSDGTAVQAVKNVQWLVLGVVVVMGLIVVVGIFKPLV
ncbi:Conserved_hypothetical protein [Hexamita inflata]|uniref:Uncharacterized protein n=1 Tax=Hexamita inflata TaxID=28002 RepID=A0AA86R495_9EUKA|nr:Conserved hypothetical protein [Hexamita inflata]